MTAETQSMRSVQDVRNPQRHHDHRAADIGGAGQVEVASADGWTAVCRFDDLIPGRGVAALVAGEQIAVFRDRGGAVYAVGNRDPFSGAYVMSRGIVGTRGDVPVVMSPMYKEAFDLRTGLCLDGDDEPVALPVYETRVRDAVAAEAR